MLPPAVYKTVNRITDKPGPLNKPNPYWYRAGLVDPDPYGPCPNWKRKI